MIYHRRRRLKIVQFVSQNSISSLVARCPCKANNVHSILRTTAVILCFLIASVITFGISWNWNSNHGDINVIVPESSITYVAPLNAKVPPKRFRRDSYSEDAQLSYIASLRQPRSSERRTITIVGSNKIADDDLEVEINQNVGGPIRDQENDKTSHQETTASTSQSRNDIDAIYANTLEKCERRQKSNQTNSTATHGNDTEPFETDREECLHELESGFSGVYVISYIGVGLFIFVGLAIVCDDFFIASLKAISDRLRLSEDVAGATFMAAGSSGPELFISVTSAGTGSDVGVGTIVGSAVFNLLIIIALTACLAGKVLTLDWRPFLRDSTFYAFSIVAFIFFSRDGVFQLWESLFLVLMYILYTVIMKFNVRLMEFMAKWNCCFGIESRVAPQEIRNSNGAARLAPVESQVAIQPVAQRPSSPRPVIPPKTSVDTNVASTPQSTDATKDMKISDPTKPKTGTSSSVRVDVPATSPTQGKLSPAFNQKPPSISKPPSVPKLAFQSPEKKSEMTNTSSAKEVIPTNPGTSCTCLSTGVIPSRPMCTCCVIHISNQPCLYCSQMRSPSPSPLIRCSSCSSILERSMVVSGPANPPSNGSELQTMNSDGHLYDLPNTVELKRSASLVTMRSYVTFSKSASSGKSNERVTQGVDEGEGFSQAHTETFGEGAEVQLQDAPKDENPPIVVLPCLPPIRNPRPDKPQSSECVPGVKYIILLIVYFLSYPWVCVFTWTIPKCDTPQTRKWYMVSFLMCIVWIALLSWVMTVVIEKLGCLINIDTYTMGLIVVAIGTSVPDAISSVLVAKEGHGDMAVSNAIGSNVFDINLGLGLPFFIRSIITSKPVQLMTATQMCLLNELPLSIRIVPHVKFGIILLLLLLMAVAVFAFVKFRLNRRVTFLFVSMYVAFMIYAFVQEKKCYSFFC